jgi:flavin reductase (DIM6/NTAB) family NADH-FMN oxidoreductase RutF
MTTLSPLPVPTGFAPAHELRATMRQHAKGVAVITTFDQRPVGFCATSLSSVSLEPPTVSFAVAAGSASGRAWRSAVHGIVHLLRADQTTVASAFARTGPDKFAGPVGWRWGPRGQPLLDNVLAWMLVSTRTRLMVGDHLLIVADVRETAVEPGPGPLIRCDGKFRALPPFP